MATKHHPKKVEPDPKLATDLNGLRREVMNFLTELELCVLPGTKGNVEEYLRGMIWRLYHVVQGKKPIAK